MVLDIDIRAALGSGEQLVRRGWTKGSLAEDEWDNECGVLSEDADKWCAVGALLRAAYDKARELGLDRETLRGNMVSAVHLELKDLGGVPSGEPRKSVTDMERDIWRFNDDHETTQEEMVALFAAARNRIAGDERKGFVLDWDTDESLYELEEDDTCPECGEDE